MAEAVVLLLHNRYRVPGGEERAVEDLAWLIQEHLGREAHVLTRHSDSIGPARAAAGLLAGGLAAGEVRDAVAVVQQEDHRRRTLGSPRRCERPS